MNATQLSLFPELPTGTTATALIHKGLPPIANRTSSGTQAEQSMTGFAVPDAKVEQKHKRNRKTPSKTTGYTTCSGVPVQAPVSGSLFDWELKGGQP
jgi:hypothetical protein